MIKAIETIYNGYRFRSRLEARWAVFFDALDVKYEYEKEGFDINGIWYLPDFYLPHLELYIEIKPNPGNLETWPDHVAFGHLNFIYIQGDPWVDPDSDWGIERFSYNTFIEGDCYYRWCECQNCGFIGIEFDGRSDRLACKECYDCAIIRFDPNSKISHYDSDWNLIEYPPGICPIHGTTHSGGCYRSGGNLDKGYAYDTPRLMNAYRAARQARWGHGEKPF